MIVIFYIIVGWFVLGWLFKMLLPWILRMVARRARRNMERRMKEMFNTAASGADRAAGTPHRPSGPASKAKKIDPDVGEYVHFEEISDTTADSDNTGPRPHVDYKVESQVVDIEWEDIPDKK